ncbi:ParA family protein [Acidiferrobacter thiooxydans]|jgi:chromosome partitioning protein|uniref:ParA family protein n=1 Tax=Acidiferrobacter thiooxydans TaxID=163359 RepID=UPI000826AC98|nr:ParA family protein [Acidiferrobacter thiooxydans]UEN99846.1 ParA family protein [Acidiferrobacter thiooxydans]
MKTVATINFKGGVGKTTTTWALGYVAALEANINTLMFDLDAQMSLTQAIALNEDGSPFKDFSAWYERSVGKKRTIFNALEEFTKESGTFNWGINYDFIYRISERYHFVPSAEDLYWTELDVFDREKVKFFIQRILEKIAHSNNVPKYDCTFFDCPPSFSLLSYSVLSCCNLILIPINPDFFAAKGLDLLLNSLQMRIQPLTVPRIGVFMNRAKKPGGSSTKAYSNETQRYLEDARDVLGRRGPELGLDVRLFNTAIFDRVGMKRAIQEGMLTDFRKQFEALWGEIKVFLGEKRK